MRVVFMGADLIAVPTFRRLLLTSNVAGLVTQPDRPVGRHQVMMPPAVKVLANEADVPVLQPVSLRDEEAVEQIAGLRPDLIAVMAYGQILPEAVINMAPLGCINVHASLLPRHRGASCIASSIYAGDRETGVSIIDVVKRLDAGDVLKSSGFQLMGKETAGLLHQALGELAPNVLMDAIHQVEGGRVRRIPQDEGLVTYAPKLSRRDGMIEWAEDSAQIERMIRAYDPWPGTYTMLRDNRGKLRKLKVFPFAESRGKSKGEPGEIVAVNEDGIVVSCGEGCLVVKTVQPDGGRKMKVCDFLAGRGLKPGMRFENDVEGS